MKNIIGYKGSIARDTSKPNGTPRKLMDVNRLSTLGWKYSIDLEDGIGMTYEWFLKNNKF